MGQQIDVGIFDAFSGFHPNQLGVLVGAIAAGGWLVLLTPRQEDWLQFDDPEYQSLIPHGFSKADLRVNYLLRVSRILSAEKNIVRLIQDGEEEKWWIPPPATDIKSPPCSNP